jgi:hypothetical protein
MKQRGEILQPDGPENPRDVPWPWVFFGTDSPPDEFAGFGPLHGDLLERGGLLSLYSYVPLDQSKSLGFSGPIAQVIHVPSGYRAIVSADRRGFPGRLLWGVLDPSGQPTSHHFQHEGRSVVITNEIIRHYDPARDLQYDWEAWVFAPQDGPSRSGIWTPQYADHSRNLRAISSTTGRHARRVRVADAVVERFAAEEIYERDGWVCGICDQAIDPSLRHPDPQSASLDHIRPLIAGGEHSRDNTQAAHLVCNLRKGGATNCGGRGQ